MSLEALVELIQAPPRDAKEWARANEQVFSGIFGGDGGRYPKGALDAAKLRAPWNEVPFAAYIHPSNAGSGRYGGLSFCIFPAQDGPCLVTLCVGTDGLAPDEAILGRPGHARKVRAIAAWLNRKFGAGGQVAWAKHDPTQTDMRAPIAAAWSDIYQGAWDKYGNVIYAAYRPTRDRAGTRAAAAALLDLLFSERGYLPLKGARAEQERMQDEWLAAMMPTTTAAELSTALSERHFVILEGPPGTGKTRMATKDLLEGEYKGHGTAVQFHPSISYETFIGGLAPAVAEGTIGLQFAPSPGILINAAAQALERPDRPFLLLIDEINRADLAKILGEALYLFEWPLRGERPRRIRLPFDFGPPLGRYLSLPENLHVLGTMNTADRSTAILDVAVRRRFCFLPLWPQAEVLAQQDAPEIMRRAFRELTMIFIEHATDEAFHLCPGHSYFLSDAADPVRHLRTGLASLLEEYLRQGYVASFAEPIRNYLQWLASL